MIRSGNAVMSKDTHAYLLCPEKKPNISVSLFWITFLITQMNSLQETQHAL